jgi:hypothetical protein
VLLTATVLLSEFCDSFGLRNSLASVAGSGTWLAQCDDTMQRDSEWLGLPVTSTGQRRQKWLIDAAWLDRVRKVWLRLVRQEGPR